MTYKAIIKNMAELRAMQKTEKLISENGIKFDWTSYNDEDITIDNKEIDFGISFEIPFELVKVGKPRKALKVSGFVDEYGSVHICSLWKLGAENWQNKIVWGCAEGLEPHWEILK